MLRSGQDEAGAALRALGLNQLEAEVYVRLLSQQPATGYAVAKEIGRPAANVYKAIESLARKGAVVVEYGGARLVSAVPAAEFMRQLERDFRQTAATAVDRLSRLQAAPPDERVYRLEAAAQVFEHAESMLQNARSVVVIDAFPEALARIAPAAAAAARRKVGVFVEAYGPVSIPGANIARAAWADAAPKQWRSQQLNVVADGREHVLALLSQDLTAVHQAYWSNSLYLSCLQHGGRLCEHTLVRMLAAQEAGEPPAAVLRILAEHRFFLNSEVPGQRELLARFAPPSQRKKK